LTSLDNLQHIEHRTYSVACLTTLNNNGFHVSRVSIDAEEGLVHPEQQSEEAKADASLCYTTIHLDFPC
jgi:hypothetical protein